MCWGVGRCEKVLGEVWQSVLGCDVGSVGEGVGKCVGMWKRCGGVEMGWKRCKKVCSGRCGKVLWGVGKDEERCGEVWESVFGWGEVRKSVGMWGRCGKVCWDVGEVMRGVGMGKSVGEGVGKCVEMWKRCGGVEKC